MPATYDVFSQADEIVAAQRAARAEAHARGTNLHGWSGSFLPPVKSVEEVVADIEADTARAKAFRASPRGRFMSAVESLRALSYYDEAYQLEGEYRRSLADTREPLNTEAVGAALAILQRASIRNLADAHDAREALAELLIEAGAMKLAAE
jgi:hypothetical protein